MSGGNGSSVENVGFSFMCFRCGMPIKANEKMFNVSASIDMPTDDGAILALENCVISVLCLGCASVIVAEAVVMGDLMMPGASSEELKEKRRALSLHTFK